MKTAIKVFLGWVLILALVVGFYWLGKAVYFVEDYINFGFSFRFVLKTIMYNPPYVPEVIQTVMDGVMGFAILIFVSGVLVLLSWIGLEMVDRFAGIFTKNEEAHESDI